MQILNHCSVVITSSVWDELNDIGRFQDTDAKMARLWMKHIDDLTIKLVEKGPELSNPAEDDLAFHCRSVGIPMVTDDLGAMKRHGEKVQCLFSGHIIYFLMKVGAISRKRAKQAVMKMRDQRDWKNNIIHAVCSSLFDE